MAEVVVSSVVKLLVSTVKQQIQQDVKLVRGVEKELLDLSDKLNSIRNVLEDAENKLFKEKAKDWMQMLEQTSYEMKDVLELWNYAIVNHNYTAESTPRKLQVCYFILSWCFRFKKPEIRRDIAYKVEELKSRLEDILNDEIVRLFISQHETDLSPASWRVQNASLGVETAAVKGRNDDMDILVTKLTAHEGLDYQILSIVGMGGLGKTTLAQLVYNDSRVKQCFDLRVWICVSDPFDVAVIAKGIIKEINGKSTEEIIQQDDLLQDLIGCISSKKILLVLDDVWNEQHDKWERLRIALKCVGTGSKILVTTRKEQVARIMGTLDEDIHRLELLSDKDCRLLFMHTAFGEDKCEKFQEIGKEIAKKCNGLPLAAKTLGSILRSKKTIQEWEKVLKSEFWELEQVEVELFLHLLLSYSDLSRLLKRCYSVCAFFPKDESIKVEELISIWMALGYLDFSDRGEGEDMEIKGREIFDDLVMRSLFQDIEKDDSTGQPRSCKIHGIMHDLIQLLGKNDKSEVIGTRRSIYQLCDPYLVSHAQEYCTLFWGKESPLKLRDCPASLRMLKYKSEPFNGCPQEMEKLIQLRWLDISCTRLSKEVLKTICKLCLLQTLLLSDCSLEEIPCEIGNLVRLRHLDLSWNRKLKVLPKNMYSLVELKTLLLRDCSMEEILDEIKNLVHLRHLDLSWNRKLKVLPRSMYSLLELETLLLRECSLEEIPGQIKNLTCLRHLDVSQNYELKEFKESIYSLDKLRTLDIEYCWSLRGLPEGLVGLSDFSTLNGFIGGTGYNKFGLLKDLNGLSNLSISVSSIDMKELAGDAREAELKKKTNLQTLEIKFIRQRIEHDFSKFKFICQMVEEECSLSSSSSSLSSPSTSSLSVDVIEALEPHEKLQCLKILHYMGSRLPNWISSLNQVREIQLWDCSEVSSLPPLGKLQSLEKLHMRRMEKLEVLGVEWLGIEEATNIPSSPATVAFPKLKELKFEHCRNWREWKDIPDEEEKSATMRVMPRLTHLSVSTCNGLEELPHRLLHKASYLKLLCIRGSPQLMERYVDQNGSPWRSLSQNNPDLFLSHRHFCSECGLKEI